MNIFVLEFLAPDLKSEYNNVSENSDGEVGEDTGKFDLKLLMDPVVYTLKLDDMEVLKNKSIESVKSDDLIKKIDVASKIPSPKTSIIKIKDESVVEDDKEIYDDIFNHGFDDNELDELIIEEDKKVKLTSYLLNKPRVRAYNFITLCKNPDFNTRLKRLNVGFFSSWRNRALLKECKPLTIDVSKAFEEKLINGVLYLKETNISLKDTATDNNSCGQTDVNINTSSMTSQSLIDGLVSNMLPSDNLYREPNQIIKRNTIINLPYINDVRRINQQLLTAEVSPIQIKTSDEVIDTNRTITSNMPELNKDTQDQVTSHDSVKSKTTEIETNKNIPEKKNDVISDQDKTQVQPKVRQKRQPKYPVVSWLSRPIEIVPVDNDVLLTMDTLKKMIQVMDGITPLPAKKKKKLKTGQKSKGQHAQTRISANNSSNVTGEEKCLESNQTFNVNSVKPAKPKAKGRPRKKPSKSGHLIPLPDIKDSTEQPADITYLSDYDVASNEVYAGSPVPPIKINIHTDLPTKPISHASTASSNMMSVNLLSNDKLRSIVSTDKINVRTDLLANHMSQSSITSSHNMVTSNFTSNDIIHNPVPPINNTIITDLPFNISPTSSSYDTVPCITLSNDNIQSSISDTVNHLLIESSSISALPKTTNDASTTTSDQEIQGAIQTVLPQTIQTVNRNPIFSVLPMPKSKNIKKPSSTASKISPNTILNVNNEKTCSCALPIVKSNDKHIILDGSNYCSSHGLATCINRKKSTINEKDFKKLVSESSLRLSKDKILLSTVTFSRSNVLQIETGNASNFNTDSSTPLPPGVQLVLPPNGELTYFVQPGVVLEDNQLTQLQSVIEAVKLKISSKIPSISAQPICISNEIVDLTIDDVQHLETQNISKTTDNVSEKRLVDTETENLCVITNLDTSNKTTVENVIPVNSEQKNECITKENSEDTYGIDGSKIAVEEHIESISVNIEQNCSNTTSIPPLECNTNSTGNENLSNLQLNVAVNEIPSNTDNKLEDIKNSNTSDVPKENTSIMNRKSILSDLMEISGISEEDIAPAPAPLPVSGALPALFPVEYNKPIITLNADNLSIAPITSFKELKYAYENNASFFELNCNTGIIQKVNVCLTKTTKSVPSNNDVQSAESFISHPPPLKTLTKTTRIERVINKNVGARKPIIIRKLEKFKPLNFKTMKKMKISLLKPNLSNVRKVLMRSKVKLYEKHKPPVTLDITNDDSDSSDDEPLIKKAKRMKEVRENHLNPSQIEEVNKTYDQECSAAMEVEVLEHEQPLTFNVSVQNIDNTNMNNDVGSNQEANGSALDEIQQVMDRDSKKNVEDSSLEDENIDGLAHAEENLEESAPIESEVLLPIKETVDDLAPDDLIPVEALAENSSDEECILGV